MDKCERCNFNEEEYLVETRNDNDEVVKLERLCANCFQKDIEED